MKELKMVNLDLFLTPLPFLMVLVSYLLMKVKLLVELSLFLCGLKLMKVKMVKNSLISVLEKLKQTILKLDNKVIMKLILLYIMKIKEMITLYNLLLILETGITMCSLVTLKENNKFIEMVNLSVNKVQKINPKVL